jgi:hypothetical protein
VRTLGEHVGDGEAVHQSAIDRRNLPACAYDPANLKALLAKADALEAVNTTRIPRGVPCPDLVGAAAPRPEFRREPIRQ